MVSAALMLHEIGHCVACADAGTLAVAIRKTSSGASAHGLEVAGGKPMPATQVYSDPVVIAAGSAFSFVLDPLFDAFEFDLAAKIEAGIGCLAACDRVGIATEDCANLKAMGDDAIREAHKGVRFHMLLAFAYAPVWHGLAKIAAAEVSRNGLMIMDSAPIRRVVDAAPVLRVFAEGCWSDPVQASGMMQAVLDLPTLTVQDVTSI